MIYVASKTAHAETWQRYRAAGAPILSTWIDEAGPGETVDFADLWRRCLAEVRRAAALVLYVEPGEALKGALCEVGAALAAGVPVFWVGPIGRYSVAHAPGVLVCETLADAMERAAVAVLVAEHGDTAGVWDELVQRVGGP